MAHAGSVGEIWRFPVKSMQGERLAAADFTASGLTGDRAYALIDAATGKVASAKAARMFPGILGCTASFIEPPRPGAETPPVRIAFPDGASVTSDAPDAGARLSAYFGREVRLARSAPEDFTIEQYVPDIEGADAGGRRDVVVDAPLGGAIFAQLGVPSPLAPGSFLDAFPVSILTTSTLAHLHELAPGSRFDVRRFRMNLILDTGSAAFVENEWLGKQLAVGDGAGFRVTIPDPRCVITTLEQPELPEDSDVLRALVSHNRLDVAGNTLPCAGVYAVVSQAGVVRVGDTVAVA